MERPVNRSYALRGARGTLAQEAAYEAHWPEFGIEPQGEIDPIKLFPQSNRHIMEIGSGMGEATVKIAGTFPETGFLVCEVHKPGVGALMNNLKLQGSTNVKIIEEDATLVLQHNVPNHSFDALHLYFPDPWPKSRHWKRRIVQDSFLQLIHSKLKPGGYIHIATDWIPYAKWIKDVFSQSALFTGGEIAKPEFRPVTKFEGQGISKGHIVTDLQYFKV